MADAVTFYYPGMHQVRDDGTIAMRATGHDEGGLRWTGQRTFSPDAADYDFWRWVVSQRERWANTPFFSSDELPIIRKRLSNPMGGELAGEPTGLGKLRSPLGLPSYWAKLGYSGSRPLSDLW